MHLMDKFCTVVEGQTNRKLRDVPVCIPRTCLESDVNMWNRERVI